MMPALIGLQPRDGRPTTSISMGHITSQHRCYKGCGKTGYPFIGKRHSWGAFDLHESELGFENHVFVSPFYLSESET